MSFSSAILHNDGQGLSTMYIIQAWDVFVVHLLCAFNIVPRSFPVRPGASFPVSRGFKIPTWRRNLPSIHGYTTSSELRQQKYVTWGLLRWRATAQSSGFESWYTQSNFTLLNSVILRKISPIPNLFLVFFFAAQNASRGVPTGFVSWNTCLGFPMHPWLVLIEWASALTWQPGGLDKMLESPDDKSLQVSVSCFQKILKKSPEAAQNVFFFLGKIWLGLVATFFFFQWQFCASENS